MREKQIEKRLVDGVKRLGGIAFKFVSPGNAGVPDRMILLPGGRIAFIELKAERGKLTQIQVHQLERLKALGFDAHALIGMAEVVRYLATLAIRQDGGGPYGV